MTARHDYAKAAAILATAAPACPYCGEPGRIVREYSEGTLCQCHNPRCKVQGSWTVETEEPDAPRQTPTDAIRAAIEEADRVLRSTSATLARARLVLGMSQ